MYTNICNQHCILPCKYLLFLWALGLKSYCILLLKRKKISFNANMSFRYEYTQNFIIKNWQFQYFLVICYYWFSTTISR